MLYIIIFDVGHIVSKSLHCAGLKLLPKITILLQINHIMMIQMNFVFLYDDTEERKVMFCISAHVGLPRLDVQSFKAILVNM